MALREKKISFDNECTAEMMDKIGKIFKTENGFVPEGWMGITDSYPLFLTQKAAMRLWTGPGVHAAAKGHQGPRGGRVRR